MGDPRVYFSAERTLLAWLRTAIAVIGLGFLVARFGLFQRPVSGSAGPSVALGVGLIALGSIASAAAALQHVRYVRALPAADRPSPYALGLAPATGLALAAVGGILAVYLIGSM